MKVDSVAELNFNNNSCTSNRSRHDCTTNHSKQKAAGTYIYMCML